MVAEYPGAKWIPAAPTAYRKGPHSVDLVVMHITSGHAVAENTAAMFAKAGSKSSAHFVIGQDGVIVQCVALADIAQHAHLANGHSIGIEHCARERGEFGPKDLGLPLSEVQIVASVALVRWLCARFSLPVDRGHIRGHAEADPATSHDGCPEAVAGGWPWGRWVTIGA